MFVRKRHVQLRRRRQRRDRCCDLSVKDGLQFLSSLILPLMLGVFTVVITFQQQKLAQDQRKEDMVVARQQRLEDKDESQLQREQDRDESQTQRDQDRKDLQLQRQQDQNELRLHREQEWNIAQTAQAAQSQALIDQYRDEVLVNYIKEMGDLLESKKDSVTSNSLTHALARAKTLNTFRQLDQVRQLLVLRFLYEVGQLTNTNELDALDISSVKLSGIDFRETDRLILDGKISLAGVHLSNSTFDDMELNNIQFSSTKLDNVRFLDARFKNVNFSLAELHNVNCSSAQFENVDFSTARLTNIDFSSVEFRNISFAHAKLADIKSSPVRLGNINFSNASLVRIDLSNALLDNITFSTASFQDISFSSVVLANVTFPSATLIRVSFVSAELHDAHFSSAKFTNVNFASAKVRNVSFSLIAMTMVNFSSAEFVLGSVRFDYANMFNAIFDQCVCEETDFSYSNLRNSSFHSAKLNSANFTLANLQNADFTNSTITDSQLQSALSIRNAKLPNGTLGQGRNLIRNGDAHCNISLINYWRMQNGSIAVVRASNEDQNQCQFSLQSTATGATMSQRIILVDIWDFSLWPNSTVQLQAEMSRGVSIELMGKSNSGTILSKYSANTIDNKLSMDLKITMQELEVVVKFDGQNKENPAENIWCDNIELFVNYNKL